LKTSISVLTLAIGLTTDVLAQPAPPEGIPPAVPVIPVPGNNGVATNNINPANTNWSNDYHGNYGATNGNGGMTNGIYGNSYASYTNPYYTYANTNVLYTNPYYIYARTNAAYVNPNWSNANRDMPSTNDPTAADISLTNTNTVHHWWKWW
jgi:hypothetical protein